MDIKPTKHEQELEDQRKLPTGFDAWIAANPPPDMNLPWPEYQHRMAKWQADYRWRHL